MQIFDVAVPAPAEINDHPCPSGRRSTISGKRLCLGHCRHACACTPAKVHSQLIYLLFSPSRGHEVHFEVTHVVKRSYCIAGFVNAVMTMTRRAMDRFGTLRMTNNTFSRQYTRRASLSFSKLDFPYDV
jgi:hypothetical protein